MVQNGRKLTTPQAVNGVIKDICNVLRRSGAAGAMQYVPELTWLLFLRILDEREESEAERAEAQGWEFTASLEAPYRWRDWAAPGGEKRKSFGKGELGKAKKFVDEELLPYLRELGTRPFSTPRQRVISEIMTGFNQTRIDTDTNLLDVLDRVHAISERAIDRTHVFPISQAYEGLLLQMGEKNNDGGQFFTPREVIRAVVSVINPQAGERIYDPACGTGGFLAQAYDHIWEHEKDTLASDEIERLRRETFYGRDKEDLIYPIALANLVLHGIDEPHIWHGNTLTVVPSASEHRPFGELPTQYDVVLTNPPFGGKENKQAQDRFTFKTSSTQVLFIQYVVSSLRMGGRCGMVLDEGVLFRANETAFVQTKRKLLDDCDVWCIVSLPAGTFIGAGGGVKTNLVFFTKGKPTETIWYYDLSDVKVTKRNPLTIAAFEEFFHLLPDRADSARSWTVDIAARRANAKAEADLLRSRAAEFDAQAVQLEVKLRDMKRAKDADPAEINATENEQKRAAKQGRDLRTKAQAIEDAVYDLKAVNPIAAAQDRKPTTRELLDLIEAKGREVNAALARLRALQNIDD